MNTANGIITGAKARELEESGWVVVRKAHVDAMRAALDIYADESNWDGVLVGDCGMEYTAFSGHRSDIADHDDDPWAFAQKALDRL